GLARTTLSRGEITWHDGDVRATRGRGRYVERPCFPPYWHAQVKKNDLATPTKVEREPFRG
ncbi:MAG: hypothetical protein KC635_16850, partial [Myxococcales bacterium]|nr:hypothetical protein [Myxococcales bacterium]